MSIYYSSFPGLIPVQDSHAVFGKKVVLTTTFHCKKTRSRLDLSKTTHVKSVNGQPPSIEIIIPPLWWFGKIENWILTRLQLGQNLCVSSHYLAHNVPICHYAPETGHLFWSFLVEFWWFLTKLDLFWPKKSPHRGQKDPMWEKRDIQDFAPNTGFGVENWSCEAVFHQFLTRSLCARTRLNAWRVKTTTKGHCSVLEDSQNCRFSCKLTWK